MFFNVYSMEKDLERGTRRIERKARSFWKFSGKNDASLDIASSANASDSSLEGKHACKPSLEQT